MLLFTLMDLPDPHANAKFALDVIDNAVKFVALVVGGLWALMNYKRGRVHRRKLELDLSGRLFRRNGKLYFAGSCRLKNVGQSKYPIQQDGTTCQLFAYRGTQPELLRTFTIFEHHGWIEPGEQIDEPLILAVRVDPAELIALKAEFRVVSEAIEWNSSCIFPIEDDPRPQKEDIQAPEIENKEAEHGSAK